MSLMRQRRNLSGSSHMGETFTDMDLRHALAWGSTFEHCLFKRCKMDQAEFGNATFKGTFFDECQMQQTKLSARFDDCNFVDSNLDGAIFAGAPIQRTYFEKCRLEYAVLSRATIRGGGVVDCQLHGAYLDVAESCDVDFSGSNLWGAIVPMGCALIVGNKFDHRSVQMMLALLTHTKADEGDLAPIRRIVEYRYAHIAKKLVSQETEPVEEPVEIAVERQAG